MGSLLTALEQTGTAPALLLAPDLPGTALQLSCPQPGTESSNPAATQQTPSLATDLPIAIPFARFIICTGGKPRM